MGDGISRRTFGLLATAGAGTVGSAYGVKQLREYGAPTGELEFPTEPQRAVPVIGENDEHAYTREEFEGLVRSDAESVRGSLADEGFSLEGVVESGPIDGPRRIAAAGSVCFEAGTPEIDIEISSNLWTTVGEAMLTGQNNDLADSDSDDSDWMPERSDDGGDLPLGISDRFEELNERSNPHSAVTIGWFLQNLTEQRNSGDSKRKDDSDWNIFSSVGGSGLLGSHRDLFSPIGLRGLEEKHTYRIGVVIGAVANGSLLLLPETGIAEFQVDIHELQIRGSGE